MRSIYKVLEIDRLMDGYMGEWEKGRGRGRERGGGGELERERKREK